MTDEPEDRMGEDDIHALIRDAIDTLASIIVAFERSDPGFDRVEHLRDVAQLIALRADEIRKEDDWERARDRPVNDR